MKLDAQTGKLFLQAAEILETEGHVKGELYVKDHGYCAVGALTEARMREGLQRRYSWNDMTGTDEFTYETPEALAFGEWLYDNHPEWVDEDEAPANAVWMVNDALVNDGRGREIIEAFREAGSSATS